MSVSAATKPANPATRGWICGRLRSLAASASIAAHARRACRLLFSFRFAGRGDRQNCRRAITASLLAVLQVDRGDRGLGSRIVPGELINHGLLFRLLSREGNCPGQGSTFQARRIFAYPMFGPFAAEHGHLGLLAVGIMHHVLEKHGRGISGSAAAPLARAVEGVQEEEDVRLAAGLQSVNRLGEMSAGARPGQHHARRKRRGAEVANHVGHAS